MERRTFLRGAAATAATATALLPRSGKAAPSERVRVGVLGAGGRALSLNRTFASNPNAEIVAIADIDSRRLPKAVEEVRSRQATAPRTTGDFRTLIDDKSIDAIVIGTPDHWHAIPTILASSVLVTRDLLQTESAVDWSALGLGILLSGITAYLAIFFFLRFIERIGMWPFVIYRLLLGVVIILLVY